MKEKFKWDKFIADCILCFSIVIVSPFVLYYITQPISDSFSTQWLLYPIEQWFGIEWLDAGAILWFTSLSIIAFILINIFYKIHKLSLILSLIFMICYATLASYFFSHL